MNPRLSATFVLGASLGTILLASAKPGSVEATIRQLDADWVKAAATRNPDKWVAFYSDNAVVLPPNEPVADTKAKIRKSIAAFLSLPELKVTWNTARVEVSKSGDMAYCYGHYKVAFRGEDGKMIEDHGKNLEVWRKQKDGKWKCIADTWNTDLPAGS